MYCADSTVVVVDAACTVFDEHFSSSKTWNKNQRYGTLCVKLSSEKLVYLFKVTRSFAT